MTDLETLHRQLERIEALIEAKVQDRSEGRLVPEPGHDGPVVPPNHVDVNQALDQLALCKAAGSNCCIWVATDWGVFPVRAIFADSHDGQGCVMLVATND